MGKGRMLILVLTIVCLSGCIWLCSGAFSEKRAVTEFWKQALMAEKTAQAQRDITGQCAKPAKKDPSLAATKPVLTRRF